MSDRKYYVMCEQNCKFESMTKEQILTAITQAVKEGTVGDIDTGFVTTLKTINGQPLKFFVGNQSEYEKLTEAEKENLFAIITNDKTKESLLKTLEALQKNHDDLADGLRNGSFVVDKAKVLSYINLDAETDLNDKKEEGVYFLTYNNGYKNIPSKFISGWLDVKTFGENYIIQTLSGARSMEFTRFFDGTWEEWKRHATAEELTSKKDPLVVYKAANATQAVSANTADNAYKDQYGENIRDTYRRKDEAAVTVSESISVYASSATSSHDLSSVIPIGKTVSDIIGIGGSVEIETSESLNNLRHFQFSNFSRERRNNSVRVFEVSGFDFNINGVAPMFAKFNLEIAESTKKLSAVSPTCFIQSTTTQPTAQKITITNFTMFFK